MLKELIPVVILCVRKARCKNRESGFMGGDENCKTIVFSVNNHPSLSDDACKVLLPSFQFQFCFSLLTFLLSPYFPSFSLLSFFLLTFLLSLSFSLSSPPVTSPPPSFSSSSPHFALSVQISPKISPNNGMYVHHMLLYQCLSLNETTDLGMGYDCNKATNTIGSCRLGRPIITAWAVGGNVRA